MNLKCNISKYVVIETLPSVVLEEICPRENRVNIKKNDLFYFSTTII